MKITTFIAAYFTLAAVYFYTLGYSWRRAKSAMQKADMLNSEIFVYKALAIMFWPLLLCLDMAFPPTPSEKV